VKYSIAVNDSARHVVSAKSVIGALAIGLKSIEEHEPKAFVADHAELHITVKPMTGKEKTNAD
jgi:hypothetical protein